MPLVSGGNDRDGSRIETYSSPILCIPTKPLRNRNGPFGSTQGACLCSRRAEQGLTSGLKQKLCVAKLGSRVGVLQSKDASQKALGLVAGSAGSTVGGPRNTPEEQSITE
jgi:hypothetical protein